MEDKAVDSENCSTGQDSDKNVSRMYYSLTFTLIKVFKYFLLHCDNSCFNI